MICTGNGISNQYWQFTTLHLFATTLHLLANLLLQIYISYRLLTLLTLCFLLKSSLMISMVTYGLWNSLKTLSGPQCFVFPNYTYQWTTAYSVYVNVWPNEDRVL